MNVQTASVQLKRGAAAALVGILLGASAAQATNAPTVPSRVTITETVFVFRTFHYGRAVSVLLKTNTILEVSAQVTRAGQILGKTTQVVPSGASHDVVVSIPRSVAAGPATLVLKLTDQLNRSRTLTQTVRLPTPKAVPYRR